ncbi:PQQ-binding-like beta-propeller repeat protein [Streptomyces sp. NPDC001185]|uniref:outer membrane protein assembly factor BamB family protein n=1 Tax=Streptomyces sp. NPDC001185 TaxID=3154380 RepID=UPI0033186EDB
MGEVTLPARGGRPWGPIKAHSEAGARLAELLRELVDQAQPRRTLAELGRDLGYSRGRLSDFLSGSSVPPLKTVEQLVVVTVGNPQLRAEQLKRVRTAHAAAVQAPPGAAQVVVERPASAAAGTAVVHVQSELLAAQRTIIELQQHKAVTEKLLLFLVTVNTVLRHRTGPQPTAGSDGMLREHPAGITAAQVAASLDAVAVRGEDRDSLQEQVAAKIAHAGAVVRRIEVVLAGAQTVKARLEAELEDLHARGVQSGAAMLLTDDPADATGESAHTRDVLDVLDRADAMLQETEDSVDRLQQQVSAHQNAAGQPASPTLDNLSTSQNDAEQPPPARPSRRRIVLAAAAAVTAAAAGYGINTLLGASGGDRAGSGGPRASASTAAVKTWSWTHATGHAVYMRPGVTGDTLLTVEGPTSASAAGGSTDTDTQTDDKPWLGYSVDALDIRTGRPLWRGYTSQSDMVPPARDGRVFLTPDWKDNAAGQLTAYDAKTGQKLWTYGQGQDQLSIPTVSGGTLYVCSTADSAVHAVDGRRIWRSPVPAVGGLQDPLALYEGVLFLRAGDGSRLALDATTGKTLWHVIIQDAPVCPAGDGKVILAVDGDGSPYVNHLRCADARTGTTTWKATATDYLHWPGTLAGTTLYVTDNAGALNAYSTTDGKRLWRTELGSMTIVDIDGVELENAYHSRYCAPALYKETLYVGTSLGLHAVDATTGHQRWRHLTTGPVLAPAIATSKTVYATSQGATVYALNPHDGSLQWSLTTRSSLFASPAVTATHVAVTDDTGHVYSLDRTREHHL